MKLFAKELVKDDALNQRFNAWRENYIKQKAGGRKRVTKVQEQVCRKTATTVKMTAPPKKFYTPKAFKKRVGVDHTTLKLKLRMRKFKGEILKGIILQHGDEGIYD